MTGTLISRLSLMAFLGFASAWAIVAPFLGYSRLPNWTIGAAVLLLAGWLYHERNALRGEVLHDAIVFRGDEVLYPGTLYRPEKEDHVVPLSPDMVRLTTRSTGEVFEERSVFLCWEPNRAQLKQFAHWTDRQKLISHLSDILAVNPSPDFESYGSLFGIRFTKIDFGTPTKTSDDVSDFFSDFLKTATTLADAIRKKEEFFQQNPELKNNKALYMRLESLFADRAATLTDPPNGRSDTRRPHR